MSRHKQDWEDLAEIDPYWAILSSPARQFGGWDLEAFFHQGELEFAWIMEIAARLGFPRCFDRVLDFGCGVGRVTRAMSQYFTECYGFDISERMLAKAGELNDSQRCNFVLSGPDELAVFPENHFDMVYSDVVLQHLPTQKMIEVRIADFFRITKPGGLVAFQLLYFIPFRYRFQPARRAYTFLRWLGVSHRILYRVLRLNPIRSNYLKEERVLAILDSLGARCLEIQRRRIPDTSVGSATYFFTKS
jgi:ubiquinone/menaquinone biosynthesis C-methylase UbiE